MHQLQFVMQFLFFPREIRRELTTQHERASSLTLYTSPIYCLLRVAEASNPQDLHFAGQVQF
jgi:hypothetical protein